MQRRSLEEVLKDFASLEIGTEYPVCGTPCIHCQSEDLAIEPRFRVVPGASLAGMQAKVSGRKSLWLRCKGCGRESEGKVD